MASDSSTHTHDTHTTHTQHTYNTQLSMVTDSSTHTYNTHTTHTQHMHTIHHSLLQMTRRHTHTTHTQHTPNTHIQYTTLYGKWLVDTYTQHTHNIHTTHTQHTHNIHTTHTQHTHTIHHSLWRMTRRHNWLIDMWPDSLICDMTRWHMTWLFMRGSNCHMKWVTWRSYTGIRDLTVSQQPHMCDVTHSYAWHDSFICVTWLIHMCVWDSSYVTWLCHRSQR